MSASFAYLLDIACSCRSTADEDQHPVPSSSRRCSVARSTATHSSPHAVPHRSRDPVLDVAEGPRTERARSPGRVRPIRTKFHARRRARPRGSRGRDRRGRPATNNARGAGPRVEWAEQDAPPGSARPTARRVASSAAATRMWHEFRARLTTYSAHPSDAALVK